MPLGGLVFKKRTSNNCKAHHQPNYTIHCPFPLLTTIRVITRINQTYTSLATKKNSSLYSTLNATFELSPRWECWVEWDYLVAAMVFFSLFLVSTSYMTFICLTFVLVLCNSWVLEGTFSFGSQKHCRANSNFG